MLIKLSKEEVAEAVAEYTSRMVSFPAHITIDTVHRDGSFTVDAQDVSRAVDDGEDEMDRFVNATFNNDEEEHANAI